MVEGRSKEQALRSASAQVVVEILRTPAVKQLLRAHLAEPGDPPERVVEALVWEDLELTAGLATRMVRGVGEAVRGATALGRSLERLPEPLLKELTRSVLDELSGMDLAEPLAVWSRVLERAGGLAPESRERAEAALVRTLVAGLELGRGLIQRHPELGLALVRFGLDLVGSGLRSGAQRVLMR